jgi:RNA polymerase sigma factor (sigma-70 family)
MLNRRQEVVLPHLCRMIGPPSGGDVPDRELLERFLARHDPAAFAALVRRHGPTVLGLCRRLLGNAHDAEDVFQATFLVLVRKGRSIARREALGSWLHGVAYRLALKARADAVRRRTRERHAATLAGDRSTGGGTGDDLRSVIDEEVSRLPDKYRRPVLLCYFEGKTYQEAARLLGWPAGTASARLARARDLLRSRLAGRGLALSSLALAAWLAGGTTRAAEAGLLVEATADAALRFAADPAAGGVSPRVIALTEGVVKAMFLRKLKALAGVVLAVGVTCAGTAALWRFTVTGPAVAADPPARVLDASTGPPPRALAPPAGARTPQTRIGLINLTRVLKGSKKFQAMQADLHAKVEQAQKKMEALKAEVAKVQAESDDPATPAARREQCAKQLRQARREMEDEQESARAVVAKLSGDALVTTYKEVEDAARRIATAQGLELVLYYNDAVTETDFYTPETLQRKMTQSGALVPMIVSPGIDVTDTLIEALNRTQGPADGPRN